jgi:hypothetical protein
MNTTELFVQLSLSGPASNAARTELTQRLRKVLACLENGVISATFQSGSPELGRDSFHVRETGDGEDEDRL